MKKRFLIALLCATMATGPLFGQQHMQSMSFTGPTDWIPGTSVTLNVFLSFNYNAYGVSYWLEVPDAIAPFLAITAETYFFPFFEPPSVAFDPFSHISRPGYISNGRDLGASTAPDVVPPSTYHIADITLTIDTGAPLGTFTMYTTSTSPRISAVTDTDFMENNITPPGQFVFNIVPEPSTPALIGAGSIGLGLLICRRRGPS